MTKKRWRTQYDDAKRVDLKIDPRENMTDPSYGDECDINRILARYQQGQPLPISTRIGRYGDFAEAPDFMRAQEIIRTATEQFDSLPSSVRTRFENRPEKFLDFVHDPANLQEARKLGLLKEQLEPKAATTTTDTSKTEAKP